MTGAPSDPDYLPVCRVADVFTLARFDGSCGLDGLRLPLTSCTTCSGKRHESSDEQRGERDREGERKDQRGNGRPTQQRQRESGRTGNEE